MLTSPPSYPPVCPVSLLAFCRLLHREEPLVQLAVYGTPSILVCPFPYWVLMGASPCRGVPSGDTGAGHGQWRSRGMGAIQQGSGLDPLLA